MSTLQKISIVALSLVTMVGMSGVGHAVTASELQSMSRDQLLALLVQLLSTSGTTTTTGTATACTFTRNLYPGVSGADVKCLQQYLNGAGYTIASTGAGSPGSESEYYGSKTQAAVQKWQSAMGLSYGSYGGYFGPSSRAKYSAVAGTTGTTGTTGTVVTVPSGTDFVVQAASDNPSKKTLGSGTSFNPVLKVVLAAGSKDVSVSSVTLMKTGFVANTNINGVDIVDAQGTRYGNVITSINADNTIVIPIATPLVVKAGASVTLTFRVNLNSGNYNGTVSLALQSVTSDATSVTASYPIQGVAMDVVNGGNSIASTSLDVLTSTGSSTLNVDAAHAQEITRFRIQELSSNEDTKLYGLTLYNYGSASDTDYKDVTLEAVDGTVLATAQPSGKYVTFSLASSPYLIAKGQTKDFIVRTKIVDGAANTIRFVVYNNYDIDLRGVSTGVSLLPGVGTNDTTFPIGNAVNTQTIGSGSMAFSRSTNSPSGSVAPGATGVTLASYIAKPTGENYELRQVKFYIATSTTGKDLNGTVYIKVNGATVYSSAATDFTNGVGTTAVTKTLSTYPILTAGTDNTITVSTDIPTLATSTSSYQVKAFDLFQAKRLTTGDLVDPTVSAQDGYSLAVSAASLAVTTLGTPAAGSVVAGTNSFEFARFYLNAAAGGENVRITKVMIDHNGSSTINTDVGNYKLYKDANGNGVADASELLATSDSQSSLTLGGTAGTDDYTTFTFSSALVIQPSVPVTLIMTGDVLSSAGTGSINRFNIDGTTATITATGETTGNTVTPTYSGAGQNQTLVAAGQLVLSTISGSGASPSSNFVIVAGTNQAVFAFKMTSLYEGMKIKALTLTASSTTNAVTTLATSTITSISLYDGDPAAGGTLISTKAQFDSCIAGVCTVRFSADDNLFSNTVSATGKNVYIKAQIANLSSLPKWGDSFLFKIAAVTNVSSTGASSASSSPLITGTPAATGFAHVVPQQVVVTADNTINTLPGTGAGIVIGRFKVENRGSAAIYLSSTTLSFANSGSATTTVPTSGTFTSTTFKILASAENGSQTDTSGWGSAGAGYPAARGTVGTSSTISFATTSITTAEAKISGNSYRWLTIETTGVSGTNDTYAFSVSTLGNLLYNVLESDVGYNGNYPTDTDILDEIYDMYVEGTPACPIVTAK